MDDDTSDKLDRLGWRGRLDNALQVPQVWRMVLVLAREGVDPEDLTGPTELYQAFVERATQEALGRMADTDEKLNPEDVAGLLDLLGARTVFTQVPWISEDDAAALCDRWRRALQAGSARSYPETWHRDAVGKLPRWFLPVRGNEAGLSFAHGTLADFLAARLLHRVYPPDLPDGLLAEDVLAPALSFYLDLREMAHTKAPAGAWLLADLDRRRLEQGSPDLLRPWLRWASRERIERQAGPLTVRLSREVRDRRLTLSLVRELQHQGPSWVRNLLEPELARLEERPAQALREILTGGSRSRIERLRLETAQKERSKTIRKARRKLRRMNSQLLTGNTTQLLARLNATLDRTECLRLILAVTAKGSEGPAAAVIPLLSRDDAELPKVAAGALAVLNDQTVVQQLKALLKDTKPHTRAAAAKALGLLDASASIPFLKKMLHADVSEICRCGAGLALGRLGAEEAAEAVILLLDSAEGIVRGKAAKALGLLGSRVAVPALVRSLDPKFENDGITRGSAATALGQIGDRKAVDA
ncbi:MAG: HEAT repeat domain-containing protein, partial [bacterium]|nr:HEAT repeat domain-containing protein [bacterium]